MRLRLDKRRTENRIFISACGLRLQDDTGGANTAAKFGQGFRDICVFAEEDLEPWIEPRQVGRPLMTQSGLRQPNEAATRGYPRAFNAISFSCSISLSPLQAEAKII